MVYNIIMMVKKVCERCNDRLAYCKNKCARCYYAVKRGFKSDFQRIQERNIVKNGQHFLGSKFLVDKDDFDRFKSFIWWNNGDGYAKHRKLGYLHRVICPQYKRVDHINRNTFDNRKENLREGHWINILNTEKRKKPLAVRKNRQGKWYGSVRVEGVTHYVRASNDKANVIEEVKKILVKNNRLSFYNI